MIAPSYTDAYEVLCLQAGDAGRSSVLFGDSWARARYGLRAFMAGKEFPDVYFEFPLAGDPFLDVTVLFGELEPGLRIESDAAAGSGPMLDWYSVARSEYDEITCGFELDTKNPELSAAAVHFQPRSRVELVQPFFDAIGEPRRARLYLDLAQHMPAGWELSFFGLFRGRPASPLRVCGYLGKEQNEACANDPRYLAKIFDEIGFAAYDDKMLEQASQLLAVNPVGADFQFDVYPDGSLGDVFAIDVQFQIQRPEMVRASFEEGLGARAMHLYERLGVADARWKLVPEMAFARAIPARGANGEMGRYAFTLVPQWSKLRWKAGVLQPAKVYALGGAGFL